MSIRTKTWGCFVIASICGCEGTIGLGGPARLRPASATGPCFDVDLGNGLDDGDELVDVFSCFNAQGAFAPLEPLTHHLAQNEAFWDLLDARDNTPLDIGMADAFELMVRLLDESTRSAAALTDLFAEAYEHNLLKPTTALVQQASATTLVCETQEQPMPCDVASLAERLVSQGLVERSWDLWRRLWMMTPQPEQRALRDAAAQVLYQSSTLYRDVTGNRSNATNRLLDLLTFLMSREGPAADTPLWQLLPYLRRSDLMRNMARHLARPWREGSLQRISSQLETLYTTNSRGERVGYAGVSVIEELLTAFRNDRENLDRLLHQTFIHNDYGEPVTFLQVAFDTVQQLYENRADVGEVTGAVDDLRAVLCAGGDTGELCRLMNALVKPLLAAVDVGVADVALPLLVSVRETIGIEPAYEMALMALDLDLVGETEAMVQVSIDTGLLDQLIGFFPRFVERELGTLTPLGEESLRVLEHWLNPWNEDGRGEIIIPFVALPLLRDLLRPEDPAADLDLLLGTVGPLLSNPSSAFHTDRLSALRDSLVRALRLSDGRGFAHAHTLLARRDLVTATLRLGANNALMDLLTPVEGRQGAPWYFYDLIKRGVLRRILDFSATLLGALTDHGLIDPWQSAENTTPPEDIAP